MEPTASADLKTERPPGIELRPKERGSDQRDVALYSWATAFVATCMVAGAVLEWAPATPSPWRWLPLGAAYLVGGGPILRDTWRTLREGRLSIDFLMGAAAIGAAGVGQPLEGVILIFLFSLSNALEAYAMGRTRSAISALMDIHPEEVTLEAADGGPGESVPVALLEPEQRILVRPGERIGADGKVVSGRSEVDESAITGEATPATKEIGSEVFAGTINQGGALTVEVTRRASDTMLARIVRLVEEAREARAPTQEFIDRFAHPYTLLVLAGSALTVLVSALAFEFSWGDAVYHAMTLLVVASPCALVISTPSALLSAIANGARRGVLFKGGAYVDLSGTIDTVAFDKTGTLTEGRPQLLQTRLSPNSAASEDELLRRAAVVESASEHHLARAFVEAARERGLSPERATDFRAFPGEGVVAAVDARRTWVGNATMASREGATIPEDLEAWAAEQWESGRSTVFMGADGDVLAAFSFGDRLRADAVPALDRLRSAGIRRIAVLSGDHPRAVEAIGKELGADDILAGLLPDQKVEALKELTVQSRGTAMVGDGVNDAPAMAAATVGIAMGAAGTDVAIETADIILMSDDLEKVPYALSLGARARRVVRQNVWFSVGWMALLVVAASTIGLPLTLAVVAHEGSTLLVVLNGLRLLRRVF